eukprot:scaffold219852_cov33-Tisochrysis_lutea.AAC.1
MEPSMGCERNVGCFHRERNEAIPATGTQKPQRHIATVQQPLNCCVVVIAATVCAELASSSFKITHSIPVPPTRLRSLRKMRVVEIRRRIGQGVSSHDSNRKISPDCGGYLEEARTGKAIDVSRNAERLTGLVPCVSWEGCKWRAVTLGKESLWEGSGVLPIAMTVSDFANMNLQECLHQHKSPRLPHSVVEIASKPLHKISVLIQDFPWRATPRTAR